MIDEPPYYWNPAQRIREASSKGVSLRDVGRSLDKAVPLVYEHTITDREAMEVDNLRKALRDLEQAIWTEEARMRREVLPSPPEGYRWASELSVHDVDQLSGDFMKVRLIFRLVEL